MCLRFDVEPFTNCFFPHATLSFSLFLFVEILNEIFVVGRQTIYLSFGLVGVWTVDVKMEDVTQTQNKNTKQKLKTKTQNTNTKQKRKTKTRNKNTILSKIKRCLSHLVS